MLLMGKPVNVLVLINTLFFGLLYVRIGPYDPSVLLAGFMLTSLMVLCYAIIARAQMGDQYIFLIICILFSLGVVMLYRLNPAYGTRQVTWFALGALLYFLSYFIFKGFKLWDQGMVLYLAAGFALFLATFLLGSNVKGAINWIKIGQFTFQPAEVTKLTFLFFLAAYFKKPRSAQAELIFLGLVYVHILLLFLQRDLGMAMIFYGLFISLYYVHHRNRLLYYANIGAFLVMGVVAYFIMNHVRVRFEAWLNPWRDISGRGYQITQSLFAIGEGGFFGKGLGLGSPELIPEVHTDFIFSAICEELGIFGGMAVILLYFILTYRGFKITFSLREPFKRTIALGITLIYGYQTFIIIGGVIKLIPLTGITLPFISYGGSSLVSAFIAFGILQALSTQSLEAEEVFIHGE